MASSIPSWICTRDGNVEFPIWYIHISCHLSSAARATRGRDNRSNEHLQRVGHLLTPRPSPCRPRDERLEHPTPPTRRSRCRVPPPPARGRRPGVHSLSSLLSFISFSELFKNFYGRCTAAARDFSGLSALLRS
jgi:hypothetical protein